MDKISGILLIANSICIFIYIGISIYEKAKLDKYIDRFEALSDRIYTLEKRVGIEL
jgi:hypothetical protein